MIRVDPLANPESLIKRVYSYVAYRVGDGPDAEDVTSETFERALRYRKTYDRTKGEPLAWLIGIARRCIDDHHNRGVPIADVDVEHASHEDLEEEALRRLNIRAAVLGLDERSKELIALRFGADLTARQMAELLGERTNTIEVALHRVLGRLRSVLGTEQPPRPNPGGAEKPVRI